MHAITQDVPERVKVELHVAHAVDEPLEQEAQLATLHLVSVQVPELFLYPAEHVAQAVDEPLEQAVQKEASHLVKVQEPDDNL